MRIVIDQREKLPYQFSGPKYADVQVETGVLQTADYSLRGFESRIGVERKTADDLVSSISSRRARFERELERGMGLEVFAVVVECDFLDIARGKYTPKMWPKAACESILALMQRYRCPFVFAHNRQGGEYATHGILRHFLRDVRSQYESLVKAHDEREVCDVETLF